MRYSTTVEPWEILRRASVVPPLLLRTSRSEVLRRGSSGGGGGGGGVSYYSSLLLSFPYFITNGHTVQLSVRNTTVGVHDSVSQRQGLIYSL
jgi:hypothetical protein